MLEATIVLALKPSRVLSPCARPGGRSRPLGNGLFSRALRVALESRVQMAGELMVNPVPGRPKTVARERV